MVFESVDPGSYFLAAGTHVANADLEGFGVEHDSPCHAEGFDVLNAGVTDDETGELVLLAGATNETTPFDVAAGEQVTQDIALECAAA